jgi:hypothetical protein
MSTITPSAEAIEASEARADAAGDTGLIEVTEHGDLVEPGSFVEPGTEVHTGWVEDGTWFTNVDPVGTPQVRVARR